MYQPILTPRSEVLQQQANLQRSYQDIARGAFDLRKMQEEEALRGRLSRGSTSPFSQRNIAKRTIEQQKYEDTIRPQVRQFEELQRNAAAQELQSKMAFRPAFDQLRMGMMSRMGATSFGPMAGGPQPMGGAQSMGGYRSGQPSVYGAQFRPITQQSYSAPWAQSYTAPTFPR